MDPRLVTPTSSGSLDRPTHIDLSEAMQSSGVGEEMFLRLGLQRHEEEKKCGHEPDRCVQTPASNSSIHPPPYPKVAERRSRDRPAPSTYAIHWEQSALNALRPRIGSQSSRGHSAHRNLERCDCT